MTETKFTPAKLFDIEKRMHKEYACTSYHQYRFVSLYNGMRGSWFRDKADAIVQGENHAEAIAVLHGVEYVSRARGEGVG